MSLNGQGCLQAVALAGIVNLVGDCALCLGLGWGIAGAAWATVAAQVGPFSPGLTLQAAGSS